jgi:3-hydroxyisobutyrate dehydrogenase
VGGSEEAAGAMQPIFETFAGLIIHLGAAGSGQIAKLINNSLLGANLGLAHMAASAGRELGLDRDALFELLLASSGRSFALDSYARQSDLAAFRRRLRLFDQVAELGAVLGHENLAYQALRNSSAAFFEDTSVFATPPAGAPS